MKEIYVCCAYYYDCDGWSADRDARIMGYFTSEDEAKAWCEDKIKNKWIQRTKYVKIERL